jgi:hypothetical protein
MPWWIIIGFLILLVLGTLVTLFYLKPQWFDEAEGFQTSTPSQQIYYVSKKTGAGMSYDEANIVCNSLGARLALATEVYSGAAAGIGDWPARGWIAGDKTYGYRAVTANSSIDRMNGPAVVREAA